jgi:hypothetical protein
MLLTWKSFLLRYSDLIVNSLDLLSFILITPEVLRRIAPQISRYGVIFLFFGPSVIVFLIIPYFADLVVNILGVALTSLLIMIGWFVIGGYITVLYQNSRHVPEWLYAHGFLLGVTTFFASRLLAFLAALFHSLMNVAD